MLTSAQLSRVLIWPGSFASRCAYTNACAHTLMKARRGPHTVPHTLIKVRQVPHTVPHTYGLRCWVGEADGTRAATGRSTSTALPVTKVFCVHAQLRGPISAWRHHCHLCHIENIPIICRPAVLLVQHGDAKGDKWIIRSSHGYHTTRLHKKQVILLGAF